MPNHAATLNGIRLAYRDTGNRNGPVLVLLHGFPGSSRTFDRLANLLPANLRLVAPDYPGFGSSDTLAGAATFDALADHLDQLLRHLGINRFALYMFDFGAPVGMRLVSKDPSRVSALIFQNANIYSAGLGPGFQGLRSYWADPAGMRPRLRSALLSAEGIRGQFLAGAVRPDLIPAAAIRLATDQFSDVARQDAVLDLLLDYEHNLDLYDSWQAQVRDLHVPVLAVWGEKDPIFTSAGAFALGGDARDFTAVPLAAGHFASMEMPEAVAQAVTELLSRT